MLDLQRDKKGTLSYTVAVRSLDGAGPQKRGVRVLPSATVAKGTEWASCSFPITNTGKAATPAGQHPEDVGSYLKSDVYRLATTVSGKGWTTWVPNQLSTLEFGKTALVPVYAQRAKGGDHLAKLKLTATSESDPSKKATATCQLVGI